MKNSVDSFIKNFLKQESTAGILLVGAAILAILLANSPLSFYYNLLIDTPVAVRVGALDIDKSLLLWVNDGLMALFFLLVGLELKREFLEGELSDRKKIVLPGLGAVGGMAVPALIYIFLNRDDPMAMKGWAIPAATDIAFALGVLSLLGSKVPTSLKVFLTSLAIFDDIGAILIIAFLYTSKISFTALLIAALCIILLFILNKRGVVDKSLYIIVGTIMWIATLKSGVHATLAGVTLALFIPLKSERNSDVSPLKTMEHDLHKTVTYIILPLFAFCNAGISLNGVGLDYIIHNVPLGIALGLFIGKQIGVFVLCWLGIKTGMGKMPEGMSWTLLYGTAALCGIGFTMSLFIGSLAFEETGVNLLFDERLGIILGSLASGIVGYIILRKGLSPGR
ncbi:Na+/H+ antiporter NhaA [Bacteroidota bacterium]